MNHAKSILFPGQGSQFKGMGKDLFSAYPDLVKTASGILGYSIEDLCLLNEDNRLRLTQFTQPALFVVNALGYYKLRDEAQGKLEVDFLAGHSLGEYNALLAAEAFSFETGLKLVKKRGELMGAASGGLMAAVLGVPADKVVALMKTHGLDEIDLANLNTPTQFVIAGKTTAIQEAMKVFEKNEIRCVQLNVTAPFHSRYMKPAEAEFADYLAQFQLLDPKVPVIANTTARPHEKGRIAETMVRQISSAVLWTDSVRYLMGKGALNYTEVGGTVLSKMVEEIRKTTTPLFVADESPAEEAAPVQPPPATAPAKPKYFQPW